MPSTGRITEQHEIDKCSYEPIKMTFGIDKIEALEIGLKTIYSYNNQTYIL